YYYLYYAVSSFGTSSSAIGVARSASLKTPNWQDLGIVVESYGGSSEINAIDPALFRDHDGKVYLSYGSFFGGIGLAEINQSTGKLAGSVTTIWGGGGRDIEAPYITRDGGYYYLFVNRGSCCHGVDSTYTVEVQRATDVRGPYSGTRTILPVTDGKYRGPGHIADLRQDGCHFVSTHYHDLSDNGNAKLDILRMTYSGGWPVLTRNFTDFAGCGGISDGVYAFRSRLSGKAMGVAGASTADGALVQQSTDANARHQQWYVIGHGDGYYSGGRTDHPMAVQRGYQPAMVTGAQMTVPVHEGEVEPGAPPGAFAGRGEPLHTAAGWAAVCTSARTTSANGIGLPNSQPWTLCTPCVRRNSAWASLSTPSAIILRFSVCAIAMMRATTWLVGAPVPM
ncbi:MAG: family 43 glycosylhydrolase, partial [Massilia sp.]|nr:family 43 glycosylhydrolase [Massilia sp.]